METISESVERIGERIFVIRGHKVMLDTHLAELYAVKAIRLREQVKRNRDRFPPDFMFQLTDEETAAMVSQNAIPSRQHLGGGLPCVFTQEGVAMLSSVLRSPRAVAANIGIMRAFVRLRWLRGVNRDLAAKLGELEGKLNIHDAQIMGIFNAIRELVQPTPKPKIGFQTPS